MDVTKRAEIMLQLAQLAQQLCFNGQVSTGYFETLNELQSRVLGVSTCGKHSRIEAGIQPL